MKHWLAVTVSVAVSSLVWIGGATASSIPYAQFNAVFDKLDDDDNSFSTQRYYTTTVSLSVPDHPATSATGHLNLGDPSLTMSATNLDPTIRTYAFFDLVYYIKFIGPNGSLPVMVQSMGNSTGGADAALFVYPTNSDGTFYPIAYTGASPNHTFNTNNEILQLEANTLYTVDISTYSYDSGTAFIDPKFTAAGQNASQYMFATNLSLGGGSVGTVPLPGSAPMFGAALLALGAVGYGFKGKKAASAA